MNDADTARFVRLLRWYPRAWRERNGEVLLGTLLEEAEQTGCTAPTASDRATAVVYGLGSRLTARLALWCAALALGVAVVAGVLGTWGFGALAEADAGWLLTVLTTGLCPLLVATGLIALLRDRGLLSEPRALALLPLTAGALTLAVLAATSWASGFAAADAGVAASAFANAWSWFMITGWALGAVAFAVLGEALLRRTALPRGVSLVLCVVGGGLAAPLAGASLISPFSSGIAAVALGVVVLTAGSTAPAPAVAPPRPLTRRSRDIARALSLITAVVSTVGVVYAFTGSLWFPAGPDSTIAMGQGITISLLGGLPLLGAIGIRLVRSARIRPPQTWGPLLLLGLSFAGVALAYQSAPEWDDMAPGFAVAAVLAGAALAWFSAAWLPGTMAARVAIGVLIGLVSAAFLGVLVLPMLAFPLPLLALALAIWMPQAPPPAVPQAPITTHEGAL